MFTVTIDWIEAYQSGNGGYTRDQLEQIGIQWPPVKGWKSRAEGLQITEHQQSRFEMKISRKDIRYAHHRRG